MLSFIKKLFKRSFLGACEYGNIDAVKQHLADGADVNAKNDSGWTALHIAAMKATAVESTSTIDEQLEIAELLICRGAEVNAKDKCGRTPLHQAARHFSKEIAALLIAKGAHINVKDEISGLTPLDYSENDEVTYLSEDGRELGNDLHEILHKLGAKTSEELKAEGK